MVDVNIDEVFDGIESRDGSLPVNYLAYLAVYHILYLSSCSSS